MTFVDRGDPGCGDGFEDKDYARVGIDPAAARGWRRWGIEPIDAARWLAAGIDQPVDAVRWSPAVQPEQVRDLMAKGLDSFLLARWREHGASVEEAVAGIAAGKKPEDRMTRSGSKRQVLLALRGGADGRGLRAKAIVEALPLPDGDDDDPDLLQGLSQMKMAYARVGWLDGTAKPWAAAGIDPLDARDWITLGLTPGEAAECERAGAGPTDVALRWWRAGFAPEEVAPWLGAGLTPEEAQQQKAEGVTVEQARVLRSLRQGEGET